MNSRAQKQAGLNLLEILAVVALLSFMLGIAVPSYQKMWEQQAQATEIARLQALFNRVRLLANLHNQPLGVCPSHNALSCSGNKQTNNQGDLLVFSLETGKVLNQVQGLGYVIVMNKNQIAFWPLPEQRPEQSASLIACTGFKFQQPQGLTFNNTGLLRVNKQPAASLVSLCP